MGKVLMTAVGAEVVIGGLTVTGSLMAAAKLQELGAPVPELASKAAAPATAVGEGQVLCSRCGRVMPKMANPWPVT